jgi:hypothetical protein
LPTKAATRLERARALTRQTENTLTHRVRTTISVTPSTREDRHPMIDQIRRDIQASLNELLG